ncbi:hypothetical protein HPB47_019172 [Ixodes persulcatus]|uniref:Uncharacterized protein n=1 Tax=Ixodes persulcatus TaxID=34615 RepID=A0AC60QKR6_IXOPE|nr:hypothetical protein HPB47_019172 [Ixodes persulcatus]
MRRGGRSDVLKQHLLEEKPKNSPSLPEESCLQREGLLYPSQALKDLFETMEDGFTYCFGFKKFRANSIRDIISCLSENRLNLVGCAEHTVEVTNQVIRFFLLTRKHFLVAAENASRQGKKDNIKYLKLRHTT